jgi:hypothetical protein
MELSAGNIRQGGFWRIWDEARLFRSMRNPALLKGRCGSCEFKAICGGCRAKALVAGDLMGEDPSCSWTPLGGPEIAVQDSGDLPTTTAGEWTPEALERLSKVPVFLRKLVRRKLEERAREEKVPITLELMARHRAERERELGLKFN